LLLKKTINRRIATVFITMSKIVILKSDFDTKENKEWFGFTERHRWNYLYGTNWETVKYEELDTHIGKVRKYMKRVSKDIEETQEKEKAKKDQGETPPEWYGKKLKFLEEMERKIVDVQAVLDEKLREGGKHAAEAKHHEAEETPAPAAEA